MIGFCGGPFTVAGYLVEGKPSRDFVRTKTLMYREPTVWHALMDRLAEQSARYVAAKVRAGADVIQLFDSWVGALSPSDYEEFVEPYSARTFELVLAGACDLIAVKDTITGTRARRVFNAALGTSSK